MDDGSTQGKCSKAAYAQARSFALPDIVQAKSSDEDS